MLRVNCDVIGYTDGTQVSVSIPDLKTLRRKADFV